MTTPTSQAPLENIHNFRDVAESINTLISHPLLRPGRLYRSARPDSATASDRKKLKEIYNIKTIIDLRTPTEHQEQRRKCAQSKSHVPKGSTAGSPPTEPPATEPTAPPEPIDPTHPIAIPGIETEEINLNGSAYSRALIKQLSLTHRIQLVCNYSLGRRSTAIGILGANVMASRGLSGLAIDSLTHSTREVKAIFSVLAQEARWPVLVHCSQGKDRTGVVVLLVLLLCGVDVAVVERDYRRSERELVGEREEKLRECARMKLPESFADCPAEWTGEVVTFLEREYGGVEGYLGSCGVSMEMMGAVRGMLVL